MQINLLNGRAAATLVTVTLSFALGYFLGWKSAVSRPPLAAKRGVDGGAKKNGQKTFQPQLPGPAHLASPPDIEAENLLAHVQYLDSLVGPRPAGSRAEEKALRYMEKNLKEWGYLTERQKVVFNGGHTFNLVAETPGMPGAKEIVVGAHHDTVPGAPGAVDNASGIAVLLEVARALNPRGSGQPRAYKVTFVAFGAEELNHQGSRFFVRNMPSRPNGMINLDMVGGASVFQIGNYRTDRWLMDAWVPHAKRQYHSVQSDAPFGGKSDYASFAAAGVPVAACAWDPEFAQKHSSRDSLRFLKGRGLLADFTSQMRATANSLAHLLSTPALTARKAADGKPPKLEETTPSPTTAPRRIADAPRWAKKDLARLSSWELTLLRNEPFARHGMKFTNPKIQAHFEAQPWYQPRSGFRQSDLTMQERKFVDTIRAFEIKRGQSR